ncbi:MAG: hypothetical protein ACF8CY_07040 [Gimesia chilikensis]
MKNLRLNATVHSYSTVENLEDRTLLSAVNSLIDPNVYDSPADFNPDDYGTGISNSPNRGLTNQTQSQQRSQATASEEDKQKHENDLGQVDSPSNPSQFSVNEGESIGTTGINDDIGSAQLISGLGTGMDDEFDADVTGYLSNATASTFLFPFAEDDGSITLANDLGAGHGAPYHKALVMAVDPVHLAFDHQLLGQKGAAQLLGVHGLDLIFAKGVAHLVMGCHRLPPVIGPASRRRPPAPGR